MDKTLTERVHRLEKIFVNAGIVEPEFSGCDGQEQQNIRNRDFGGGAFSLHAEAQRFRNESLSARIDQEPPSEQTAFEQIIYRIHSATDRILQQACVLEAIGSRILGSLPQEALGSGGADARGPDGTLDQTHVALNGLDYACARLEAAALRLERI